jgi:phosphatidylcholine synthase
MFLRQFFAWCAHLYTASGLILAAFIAVLIVRGGDQSFRACFALMFAATIIDATDGFFARRAHVKKVLPGFDGRRLDDIIDFQTYTSLPLLLLWRAQIFPGANSFWLFLPLLASAYGFSQAQAKTADGFFLGFPSYWNIVAFYLYELSAPLWLKLSVVVFLSFLTFIPTPYLYPSQGAPLRRLTIALGAVWAVMLIFIFTRAARGAQTLLWISLAYPAYYLAASWAIAVKRRARVKKVEETEAMGFGN